jgi:hypothetical protein
MQERNIIHSTDATDAKLAIKIINRLNKLAKRHGIQILFGKTKNLFDKFQTGCVWKVCVAIL